MPLRQLSLNPPLAARSVRMDVTLWRRPIVYGSILTLCVLTLAVNGSAALYLLGHPRALPLIVYEVVLESVQYLFVFWVGWVLPASLRLNALDVSLALVAVCLAQVMDPAGAALTGQFGRWRFDQWLSITAMNTAAFSVMVALGNTARRLRHRQLNRARITGLEARMAMIHTEAFRAKLQPEFVLDCLDLIMMRLHLDPTAADQLLVRVAEFLRMTLQRVTSDSVRLVDEVGFLRSYLQLMLEIRGHPGAVEVDLSPKHERVLVPAGVLAGMMGPLRSRCEASVFRDDLRLHVTSNADHVVATVSWSQSGEAGGGVQTAAMHYVAPLKEEGSTVPVIADQPTSGWSPRQNAGEPGGDTNVRLRTDRGAETRLMWGGASLFFALFLGIAYLQAAMGSPVPLARDLAAGRWWIGVELAARFTVVWVGLVLVTKRLASRITANGWRAVAQVGVYGALAAAMIVSFLTIIPCVVPWGQCSDQTVSWFVQRAFPFTQWLTPVFALLLAWKAALRAGHHLHDEIRVNMLNRELRRARLEVLSMQLRPHFLFNTLQSIATLMHHDIAAAERMLCGLRELFERSVGHGDAPQVPFAEELAIIRLYTDIESTRFGSQLEVDITVQPAALVALVPRFLLQPLVENSIRHAVAKAGRGRVAINARVDRPNGWIFIEVADSGPGYETESVTGFGLGLANTRSRLEALYPGMHEFTIEQRQGNGLMARIKLPYSGPAS